MHAHLGALMSAQSDRMQVAALPTERPADLLGEVLRPPPAVIMATRRNHVLSACPGCGPASCVLDPDSSVTVHNASIAYFLACTKWFRHVSRGTCPLSAPVGRTKAGIQV